jgi:hypothetical protein
LGQVETEIFLKQGLEWWNRIESKGQFSSVVISRCAIAHLRASGSDEPGNP